MKVTSSKPCKIQVIKKDNKRRQEKHALVWGCLDAGDPASMPCLGEHGGSSVSKKYPKENICSSGKGMQSKSSRLAEVWRCSSACPLC